MPERASPRVLSSWREHDTMRALHAPDRDAVRATEAARAMVLELWDTRNDRDLYNACARLGGLYADAGASPSLAAGTIDGAVAALVETGASPDPARVAAARASVSEGYLAAVRQAERVAAARSWEYPACAVRVDAETVAIACGSSSEDGEALAEWASRVATRAARDGFKQAVVSGPDAARGELGAAMRMLGISVRDASVEGESSSPSSSGRRPWLRLPWRR